MTKPIILYMIVTQIDGAYTMPCIGKGELSNELDATIPSPTDTVIWVVNSKESQNIQNFVYRRCIYIRKNNAMHRRRRTSNWMLQSSYYWQCNYVYIWVINIQKVVMVGGFILMVHIENFYMGDQYLVRRHRHYIEYSQ